MRFGVAGILLTFLFAMVIGVSGIAARGGAVALAASTTLTVIGGDVQVSHAGGAFASASDGEVLAPGDVIRTGPDTRAVLTYFEGSTVTIEPSSELAIEQALVEPNGDTIVVMAQNLGRTWHVVTKLITGGSRYEVRTPAATASVRGTAFEVAVERGATGGVRTTVIATEGVVAAAAPPTTADPMPEPVIVPAGSQTTAREGERRPDTPTLAPEPERRVTVNVGAVNALVVDPLGRANGFKDGKLVLQTPGAEVRTLAGTLVVTLPNVPDGRITTVVGSRTSDQDRRSAQRTPEREIDVPVVTTVQERNSRRAVVQDNVRGSSQQPATGVEVKRSDGESAPELRQLDDEEKRELPAPKVGKTPDPEPKRQPVFRPGLGEAGVVRQIAERSNEERAREGAEAKKAGEQRSEERRSRAEENKAEETKTPEGGSGFRPNIPLAPAPASSGKDDGQSADAKKAEESDRITAQQLEKATSDAQRRTEEEQRRAEEARRRAEEERRRAEQQAAAAAEARLRAEQEKKRAEEDAARAADAARRQAAQQEAAKQAENARRAEEQQREAQAAAERAAREAERKAEQEKKLEEAQRALERVLENLRERQSSGSKKDVKDAPPEPAKPQPPLKPGAP